MGTRIRIGRVTTGGRVHIEVPGLVRCPVLVQRRIINDARPALVQPEQVCRFCARRTNIGNAQRENDYGVRRDAAIGRLLGRLVEANRTPAEQAWIAELVARASQPVAVAPVVEQEPVEPKPVETSEQLDLFAAAVANLGTGRDRRDRKPVTRVSTRKRLAIHNSFTTRTAA